MPLRTSLAPVFGSSGAGGVSLHVLPFTVTLAVSDFSVLASLLYLPLTVFVKVESLKIYLKYSFNVS